MAHKKSPTPSDDPNIVLHARVNELVFEASLAALTGIASTMGIKQHDGELIYREKDFLEAADIAHMMGTWIVARHFAWVSGQPSIDAYLTSRDAKGTEEFVRGPTEVPRKERKRMWPSLALQRHRALSRPLGRARSTLAAREQ